MLFRFSLGISALLAVLLVYPLTVRTPPTHALMVVIGCNAEDLRLDQMDQRQPLLITYRSSTDIRLNGKRLSLAEVRHTIQQRSAISNYKPLWIDADSSSTYGEVVQLIDQFMQDTPDLKVALTSKVPGFTGVCYSRQMFPNAPEPPSPIH